MQENSKNLMISSNKILSFLMLQNERLEYSYAQDIDMKHRYIKM